MKKIRNLVDVGLRPTVIRLEEAADQDWIRESFFVTQEIQEHIDTVRSALKRDHGVGIFLIGPYGSGKSHFLAYLNQTIRAEHDPEVITLSLLNYSSEARLEGVVSKALGIELSTDDRRPHWEECMGRFGKGIVLILDELSEFLRSKPDARAFNEDIRFLQFMGEWAQDRPFFVIAAAQEAIEHTGDLEHGHYRKIKDRYPIRMLLSPAHLRDLIAHHMLQKSEGYDKEVSKLARKIRKALPGVPINYEDLQAIYPIHPMTLELLEDVRDRFSQTRGVIDFVSSQLAGDETRGISPFLDREIGAFVTPDAIVAHFQDVFEVQAEFLPLAQRLFPWYRKNLPKLVEKDKLRELTERVLRLLVLTHLSPTRTGITVEEAAHWLLFAASHLDPQKNKAILQRVLDWFVTDGHYVRNESGTYVLDLHDDGAIALDRLVAQELDKLPNEAVIFETLTAVDTAFNPFVLDREKWKTKSITWHFHERLLPVFLGCEPTVAPSEPALCIRLPWGEANPVPKAYTLIPAPLKLTTSLQELAALIRVRERPLSPEISEILNRRIDERSQLFHLQLRQSYSASKLISPTEDRQDKVAPLGSSATFEQWIDSIAKQVLNNYYPGFERIAPTHGPLPQEAFRELMRFVSKHEITNPDAEDWVTIIRESYLSRMGLLQIRGRSISIPKRIDRNMLAQQVLETIDHHPNPKILYEKLSEPVFGLVPDQVHLLLIFLLITGDIDIIKGKNSSYRSLFEQDPLPIQYDRLVPGKALSSELLRALDVLCKTLGIAVPKKWTVHSQRAAVTNIAQGLGLRAEKLLKLLAKLPEGGSLRGDLEKIVDQIDSLNGLGDELQRFEHFLKQIGSVTDFVAKIQEVEELPDRMDRQVSELGKFTYLLEQPGLSTYAKNLGKPPEITSSKELGNWLDTARSAHDAYNKEYKEDHDLYWKQIAGHPILNWEPPLIARSRHLGLESLLSSLRMNQKQADLRRCRSISNLEYQTRCSCGFDGSQSDVTEYISVFEKEREQLEELLEQFFEQKKVRDRVAEWADQGVDPQDLSKAYLDSRSPWPEVRELSAFDEFFSGVEVVRQVSTKLVTDLLSERVWEHRALVNAFQELLGQISAERMRFVADRGPKTAGSASKEQRSSLISAAFEFQEKSQPADPQELAEKITKLYAHHEDLFRVDSKGWLSYLDGLARSSWSDEAVQIPKLYDVLSSNTEHNWVLIQSWGLPLADRFVQEFIQLLPKWTIVGLSFADVDPDDEFAGSAPDLSSHPIEKINVIEPLISSRFQSFDEFSSNAAVGLRSRWQKTFEKLDQKRSLLIFGDHGFRLAQDGSAWTSDGKSSLERLVPVLELSPW